MKNKILNALALSLIVSVGSFVSTANATLIDFQTSSGVTQSGSNAVTASGQVIDGITYGFNGFLYNRNLVSDSGGFTFSDLYNDFVYINSAGPMTLSLSGLDANSQYDIRFFSSDRFDGDLSWATDMTNIFTATTGSGDAVEITWDRQSDPASNLMNSGLGRFTSSNAGILEFSITGLVADVDQTGNPFVRLNGLDVTAVPAPGSLTLLGLSLIGLGFTRRKKA
jgi:hypothetical protein